MLSLELSLDAAGDTVALELLRGTETVPVTVTVRERPHPIDDLTELADPEKSTIPKLGIIGIDVADDTAALVPALRIPSGVFVAALTHVQGQDGARPADRAQRPAPVRDVPDLLNRRASGRNVTPGRRGSSSCHVSAKPPEPDAVGCGACTSH
jgi:hypothetical protein